MKKKVKVECAIASIEVSIVPTVEGGRLALPYDRNYLRTGNDSGGDYTDDLDNLAEDLRKSGIEVKYDIENQISAWIVAYSPSENETLAECLEFIKSKFQEAWEKNIKVVSGGIKVSD